MLIAPTMSLQPGDIVWVPFPRVESNRIQSRPALVISHATLGPDRSLAWALMITSAEHAEWPGDIAISDHLALRLPLPSKIRSQKVATLDMSSANYLATLAPPDYAIVLATIGSWLVLQ
jgi:mRNA interferase MazF